MSFELPKLHYPQDALEPYISKETILYHYGKHHQTYLNNLNAMVMGTEFEKYTLEQIIKEASGPIFNNAAQVWNHNFYWNCLSPKQIVPSTILQNAISNTFGSMHSFQKEWTNAATKNFGSGWTWLVQKSDASLAIVSTTNAATPLTTNDYPLLTIDVWEHAYYIDYRNDRAKYVENFWKIVNWDFVFSNLEKYQNNF